MEKNIVIYGTGGFAREVHEILEHNMGNYNFASFILVKNILTDINSILLLSNFCDFYKMEVKHGIHKNDMKTL